MRINIGIVIIVLAITTAFIEPIKNLMPYFLVGLGLSQLNRYWETKWQTNMY